MNAHRSNFRPAPAPTPSHWPEFILGLFIIGVSVGVLAVSALQYFDVL